MGSFKQRSKLLLTRTAAGRVLLMPVRFRTAFRYYMPGLSRLFQWTFTSREFANFTYEITSENVKYLAHAVSVAAAVPYSEALAYIHEIDKDDAVRQHVLARVRKSDMRFSADETCAFGRRVGWYAFARALKPRVIVETGVDKGLGSVVLSSALLRNEKEGYPGQYFGTDKNPDAGFLFGEPYNRVGRILYGDSIESLRTIPQIDLFINDSDHSSNYERREYETIETKLSPKAIILGDNAHCNDVLATFSEQRGRQFLFLVPRRWNRNFVSEKLRTCSIPSIVRRKTGCGVGRERSPPSSLNSEI
jgi:hypothetical protein